MKLDIDLPPLVEKGKNFIVLMKLCEKYPDADFALLIGIAKTSVASLSDTWDMMSWLHKECVWQDDSGFSEYYSIDEILRDPSDDKVEALQDWIKYNTH